MSDEKQTSEDTFDDLFAGTPDLDRLRAAIRAGRVPPARRPDAWKILLGVNSKQDALSGWEGTLDLENQEELKDECKKVSERIVSDSEERERVARDAECLVTFFCKARAVSYVKGSGWVETVAPFLCVGMSRADAYNCLYAMLGKYIPRECCVGGNPFQIFRLLLLYHEPDLCSFLDTKRLHVEAYLLKWIRSLFVSSCPLDVILSIWDRYLAESDPFLVFFLALVMILNAKEVIMEEKSIPTSELIESISAYPSQLSSDDVEDFIALAKYYEVRTSQSFRRDYSSAIFGLQRASSPLRTRDFSSFLCLPISVSELIQSRKKPIEHPLRYFLVDCRPAKQYKSGHLVSSFHVDANLMLESPDEFSARLAQFFLAQKGSLATRSVAGGEHVCFLSSGREQEDQLANMVVSHLLQRNVKYMSIVKGGYNALYHYSVDNAVELEGTDAKAFARLSEPSSATATSEDDSGKETSERTHSKSKVHVEKAPSLVWKLSSAIKQKSAKMKAKIRKWMIEADVEERHVSSSDKASRSSLYKGVKPIFSIDDDEDVDEASMTSSDDESRREAINLDTWKKRADVIQTFPCNEITMAGNMHPSHLLLTKSHMFVLREILSRRGWAFIQARQLLTSVLKITSNRKNPDIITFKYGTLGDDGETTLTGRQRFIIPKAQKATKTIKEAILAAIEGDDV